MELASETSGDRCKAFWNHLILRHPAEHTFSEATKLSYRWRELPKIRLVVSQWVSFAEDWIGVYIRGETGVDPVAVQARLEPVAAELAQLIGSRLGPSKRHFFQKGETFRTMDPSQWDKMADWLHKNANAYQEALQSVLR